VRPPQATPPSAPSVMAASCGAATATRRAPFPIARNLDPGSADCATLGHVVDGARGGEFLRLARSAAAMGRRDDQRPAKPLMASGEMVGTRGIEPFSISLATSIYWREGLRARGRFRDSSPPITTAVPARLADPAYKFSNSSAFGNREAPLAMSEPRAAFIKCCAYLVGDRQMPPHGSSRERTGWSVVLIVVMSAESDENSGRSGSRFQDDVGKRWRTTFAVV